MKGAALRCPGSGDQGPCGHSWYCFVMTETELRERRGEEGHRRPDTCERHRWM